MGGAGARHLEEGDGAAHVLGLLGVGHVAHLVTNDDTKVSGMLWTDRWGKGGKGRLRDGLQPGLVRLAKGNHLSELLANDGLVDEPLLEDDSLVSPLEALLRYETHVADGGAGHGPPLVVEVGEDDIDALVLLTQQVLDRDLDVVKGDVGGAGSGGVRGLDGLGLNALAAGDEEHRQALAGVDTGDEVVREDTVGDPLLGAVDNVVLAVGGLLGGGAEAGNVGAGKGFGDGEADLLLAREALLLDLGLEGGVLVAVVENAGETNDHTGHVAVLEAAAGSADSLLGADHVVEVVKLLAVDGTIEEVDTVEVLAGTHSHVEDTSLGHAVDKLLGDDLAGALLLESLGGDVLVGEDAHGLLELAVAVLEVRGLELGGEPEGLGIWDGGKIASLGGDDGLLLALDGADGKVRVLLENLVSVKVVESGSGIGTGNLTEDSLTTGVGI